MYFDPTYILCVMLPALVLSGLAQMYVKSAYATWSKRANASNVNGVQTAQQLMTLYGLQASLGRTQGDLNDYFDSSTHVVNFSPAVADETSVASMAIAAHEFGHVQQYAHNSFWIAARNRIVPAAQIGSQFSPILIILGLAFNVLALAYVGLILFGAAVMFSVLTLPIELDASRRALKMLDGAGLLVTQDDRHGAQVMLRAAAFTYVANMLVAILNLAYYAMRVLESSNRRRR